MGFFGGFGITGGKNNEVVKPEYQLRGVDCLKYNQVRQWQNNEPQLGQSARKGQRFKQS